MVIIETGEFSHLVQDFYLPEIYGYLEYCNLQNNFLTIKIANTLVNVECLWSTIEDIILCGNTALSASPKFYEYAREFVFSDNRAAETVKLKTFIDENKRINVDGYVNFRANKYIFEVDVFLYRLARQEIDFFTLGDNNDN